jgi:hypothetical protein
MKRFLIIILLFTLFPALLIGSAGAYEKADAFIVRVYDKSVKVLSPAEFSEKVSVIVENKTLTGLRARLEKKGGAVLEQLNIAPGGFKANEISLDKGDILQFVPLSPPSQEVVLSFGKPPYEIPPQK